MSAACPSRDRSDAPPRPKREPGQVRWSAPVGAHVDVQGAGEAVGGEQVHATVADERRRGGDGIEHPGSCQLIAPHAWRLPFERDWRPKPQVKRLIEQR